MRVIVWMLIVMHVVCSILNFIGMFTNKTTGKRVWSFIAILISIVTLYVMLKFNGVI